MTVLALVSDLAPLPVQLTEAVWDIALWPLTVGGVESNAGEVSAALACLRASQGLMIKQPLFRIGSPLAKCDYHAVAAPYRYLFARDGYNCPTQGGRGAAGRHIAKSAFCFALGEMISSLPSDPVVMFSGVTSTAWRAFAADPGYAIEMARDAVSVRGV